MVCRGEAECGRVCAAESCVRDWWWCVYQVRTRSVLWRARERLGRRRLLLVMAEWGAAAARRGAESEAVSRLGGTERAAGVVGRLQVTHAKIPYTMQLMVFSVVFCGYY